ncbi:MAG: AGE family epimerase/isomerase [Tannerellaceae bacterium]|nr:AGE family epimerase/isomerase [Tannerellaceae bacterium]
MKVLKILFVLFLLFIYPSSSSIYGQMKNEKTAQLVAAVEENLYQNIIPFWANHVVDDVNGGFYGMVNAAGEGDATSPKAASLTARILWTFSALQRKDKDPQSLEMARRAYAYFTGRFIDKEYGGVHHAVDIHGNVIPGHKDIFTHAFAIFGLCEYYRATGSEEALEEAKSIFATLEQYAHDPVHGGYYETFGRDWTVAGNHQKTSSIVLHEMEALANLYRVWKSPLPESRLRELIVLFLEKMVNPATHRLYLSFSNDWTPVDRSESYGLNMQGAWLPLACAEALGDDDLIERCKMACLSMAEASVVALQSDGRMIAGVGADGSPDRALPWWAPAEAVIAFVNAWQLTGDDVWMDRALKVWTYTNRVLVDKKNGEWFYGLDRNGNLLKNAPKVNEWKCPYHHARMCMEVIRRNDKLALLAEGVEDNLYHNIIPFWTTAAVDTVNGGFYGAVDAAGAGDASAAKGLILNARILWTFSTLHLKDKDALSLKMARRAYEYLVTYFMDDTYGGGYYMVDRSGQVVNDMKYTYANTFVIYGLSEYYRATGHAKALELAQKTFLAMEHAHDDTFLGYGEFFRRDWSAPPAGTRNEIAGQAEKTTNTVLHEIEAFSNLYRVWKDPLLEKRLKELIEVFLDKVINPATGRQFCEFKADWTPLNAMESYGHDIEGAWLLHECAVIAGDNKLIERCRNACLKMAQASVEAILPDGRMIYEKRDGKPIFSMQWWVPAEAIVGLVHAWQLSGEEIWLDRALLVWRYTDRVLVDKERGEWFYGLDREAQLIRGMSKVNVWKCPYHNVRMCVEIIRRTNKRTQ